MDMFNLTKGALRACALVSLYAAAGAGDTFCGELQELENHDEVGQLAASGLEPVRIEADGDVTGRDFSFEQAKNALSSFKDRVNSIKTVLKGASELLDVITAAIDACTGNSASTGVDEDAVCEERAVQVGEGDPKGKLNAVKETITAFENEWSQDERQKLEPAIALIRALNL